MSDQIVYLRIPKPNGDVEYRAVDPMRLSRATISEVFIRARSKGNETKFAKLIGYMSPCGEGFSTELISDCIEDILPHARLAVDGNSEQTRELVQPLIEGFARLKDMFALVGAGQIQEARHEVETLMWGFNSAVCEIACKLEADALETSGLRSVKDSWEETSHLDEKFQGSYDAWCMHALEILEAVAGLEQCDEYIKELRTRAVREAVQFVDRSKSSQPVFDEVVAILDDPDFEGTDCFHIRASLYARNMVGESGQGEARKEMAADIAQARVHIARVQILLDQSQQSFDTAVTRLTNESVELTHRIDPLITQLATSRKAFIDKQTGVFKGMLKPYELPEPPIPKEDFTRAEQFVRQSVWAPRRVKERLVMAAGALPDFLGNRPRFPKDLRQAISLAEESIRVIETEWERVDSEPPVSGGSSGGFVMPSIDSESAPIPEADSSAGECAVANQSPPAPQEAVVVMPSVIVPASGGRAKHSALHRGTQTVFLDKIGDSITFEQVHELIMCVAYVLTCNLKGVSYTTTKSMLNVVARLVRQDYQWVAKYRTSMTEHITDPIRCVVVSSRAHVAQMMDESRCDWLKTTDPPNRRANANMKLTYAGGRRIPQLMAKYGLTEEQIRVAKKAKDAASLASYRERRGSRRG